MCITSQSCDLTFKDCIIAAIPLAPFPSNHCVLFGNLCAGLIAVNVAVFLLWRIQALQPMMIGRFLADPYSSGLFLWKSLDQHCIVFNLFP